MERTSSRRLGGLLTSMAIALVLFGCRGTDGRNGRDGTDGKDGNPGVVLGIVVDAAKLAPEQWAELKPTGKITAATAGAVTTVDFQITDHLGNGIKGLGFTSQSASSTAAKAPSLTNLSFTLAKLIPEDPNTHTPSKWVNYIVTTVPTNASATTVPTRPTTDVTGTLQDNGNGTYRYTFARNISTIATELAGMNVSAPNDKADLGDVTFQANRTHRVVVQLSGAARGTGSNTEKGVTVATAVNLENPVNLIYDFLPANGNQALRPTDERRDIGLLGKCNECHDKIAFHGGSGRVELKYCVTCHTDQRKYGYAEAKAGTATTYSGSTNKLPGMVDGGVAAGDMTAMVHLIHQGKGLSKTGYYYDYSRPGVTAGVQFEKLGYSIIASLNGKPAGTAMCIKCHTASTEAPQGDNWFQKPSRLACGTCHDGVDFKTGQGHGPNNLAQSTDTACAGCHDATYIKTKHQLSLQTPNNPTIPAGLVNFTYEVSTVTATDAKVTVKFRILKALPGETPTPVVFKAPAAGMVNPLDGFTGSPGFLLSYAMPEEGFSKPVDYNNLGSGASNFQPRTVSIAALLDPAKATSEGTLGAPDASGYYTASIVGPTRIFPVGSTLRNVGLQGTFSQNGVQRNAKSAVGAVAGEARRNIVDSDKCAKCHEFFLGHGGSRNYNVQICLQCHVPGMVTSGRGATDAALAAFKFSDEDKALLSQWTGLDFTQPLPANAALAFPQVSNNFKDMIHGIHAGKDRTEPIKIVRDRLPTVLTLVNGAEIGFPGRLKNCEMCHTYNGYSGVPANTLSTRHIADTGGMTTSAQAKTAMATANPTDLMTSPFAAACVSCHDKPSAQAHMTLNGGQILVTRASLKASGEACAVCHGPGKSLDPVVAHKK